MPFSNRSLEIMSQHADITGRTLLHANNACGSDQSVHKCAHGSEMGAVRVVSKVNSAWNNLAATTVREAAVLVRPAAAAAAAVLSEML